MQIIGFHPCLQLGSVLAEERKERQWSHIGTSHLGVHVNSSCEYLLTKATNLGHLGWAAGGMAGITVRERVSFPSSPYLSLCQSDTGRGSHMGVKDTG